MLGNFMWLCGKALLCFDMFSHQFHDVISSGRIWLSDIIISNQERVR